MEKLISILAISALILVSVIGIKSAEPNSEMFGQKSSEFYNQIRSHEAVTIELDRSGHCTGVVVSKDEIITAAHCVQVIVKQYGTQVSDWQMVASHMHAVFQDGTRLDAVDIVGLGYPATQDDWAILKFDEKEMSEAKARPALCSQTYIDNPPVVGKKIFHVGSPGEARLAMTFGYVSSYNTDGPQYGVWHGVVDGDIHGAPGSSGGPLFDLSGNLVGLVIAGGPSGLTSYIPMSSFTKECNGRYGVFYRTAKHMHSLNHFMKDMGFKEKQPNPGMTP